MTNYVVLAGKEGRETWEVIAEDVEAASEKKAKEIAYLRDPSNIVAIVAVPSRSWNPTPVRLAPKAVFGGPE